MAIIIPIEENRNYDDSYEKSKSAEKLVCNSIEEYITRDMFDGEVVGRFNMHIDGRNPDLILLIPNHGVLVIEIKAYDIDFIEEFTDDELIKVKDKKDQERKHPYKQAREHSLTIMNSFKKKKQKYTEAYGVCAFAPIVAMPNMSKDEYEDLGLDMPCSTEGTITKDWFKDKDTFRKNFKQAVRYAFKRIGRIEFDECYYNEMINFLRLKNALNDKEEGPNQENKSKQHIIANEINIKKNTEDIEVISKTIDSKTVDKLINALYPKTNNKERWDYSRRYILYNKLGSDKIRDIVKASIKERKKGTKIVILAINFDESQKEIVKEEISIEVTDKMAKSDIDKYDHKSVNSWTTFLFEIHYVDIQEDINMDPIVCIDGDKNYNIDKSEYISKLGDKYENIIDLFSKRTKYNHEQFEVEHSSIENDILVTAGAGTGKTFSMLGRISFLIHFNILLKDTSYNLSDVIYMMTFTNNSTDEMRSRLISHFEKYYMLTNKECYMNILEQIGDMKIKTISSMSKMLLGKYAHILGLSKNFAIKSGIYIKRIIIKRKIQEYLNNNVKVNDFISNNNIRYYELERIIEKFINYVSNRSIYLDGENCLLNDSENIDNHFKDFIQKVVNETIDEYKEYNTANDSLEMESIVTWLSYYKDQIKDEEEKKYKDTSENINKYLFIDEFQDTDSSQIDLVAFFSLIYNLKLFVVGDRKQSIYGFRGAKDTSFKELEERLQGKRKFKTLSLKKNYRTDAKLLTIFDKLFENKFKHSGQFEYEEHDKLVPQLNILKSENKDDIYKRFDIKDDSEEELYKKLKKAIELLVERINSQPTNKGDKPHQIAILTRKNFEKEIIRSLNNKYNLGIKFDTEGDFYRQDAVIDFYKLVCALLDTENPQHMYSLSLTPYCEGHVHRGKFYHNEYDSIKNIKGLDKEQKFKFDDYIKKIRNISGLKLLRDLVNENKPWQRYMPEYIPDKYSNFDSDEFKEEIKQIRYNYKQCLDQIFQMLIESNGTEYITLNQIKTNLGVCIMTKQSVELYQNVKDGQNISTKLDEDKAENQQNIEIICTTVHKSKGLEYRSVILPFTTTDLEGIYGEEVILDRKDFDKTYIEYDLKQQNNKYKSYYKSSEFDSCYDNQKLNQLSEELRILYVAMTRAEGEFYYIVNQEKEKNLKNKKSWQKYLNSGGII